MSYPRVRKASIIACGVKQRWIAERRLDPIGLARWDARAAHAAAAACMWRTCAAVRGCRTALECGGQSGACHDNASPIHAQGCHGVVYYAHAQWLPRRLSGDGPVPAHRRCVCEHHIRPLAVTCDGRPLALAGILGAGLAGLFLLKVLRSPNKSRTGDDAMTKKVHEIVAAIHIGARSFIATEYFYLSFFLAALYILVRHRARIALRSARTSAASRHIRFSLELTQVSAAIDWRTGICFLVGAALSSICGVIGEGTGACASRTLPLPPVRPCAPPFSMSPRRHDVGHCSQRAHRLRGGGRPRCRAASRLRLGLRHGPLRRLPGAHRPVRALPHL